MTIDKRNIDNTLRYCVLQRMEQDTRGTLGKLSIPLVAPPVIGVGRYETLYTLERPWLDNQRGVSCIPAGLYLCIPDYAGKFQNWVFDYVPDRDNIEWHRGNFVRDSNGCVLVGMTCQSLPDRLAVFNSKKAIARMKQIIGRDKSFYLEIRDV